MRIEKISAERTLPLRQEVLRPGRPPAESVFTGDANPEAGHFAVLEQEQEQEQGAAIIVAVGTIYREPSGSSHADERMRGPGAWRLRGMATADTFRGRGCGAKVLEACLEHARRAGADNVWCNARTGAAQFYLRHGFQTMSDVFEMPGIGPHYLMKRDF